MGLSNHFNYACLDLTVLKFFYLVKPGATLIMTHNPESVTLYHTIQHFLTLFLFPTMRI